MMSFVKDDAIAPLTFPTDDKGKLTNVVNPAYDTWIQQEQLVALEKCFATPNQNQILQLRSELFRTARGDSSIANYLDKVNVIADNLALSGSSIPDSNLLAVIMNNVGSLYESTIASAQARETPITYADLEVLLLFVEQCHLAIQAPTCDGHETDGQKSYSRFDWALPLERQNGGFLPRHWSSSETCKLLSGTL
ncbi:unnamed protein product [Prunus armeniaca]